MNKLFYTLLSLLVLGSAIIVSAQDKTTTSGKKGQIIVLDPTKMDTSRKQPVKKQSKEPTRDMIYNTAKVPEKDLTPVQKEAEAWFTSGSKKGKEGNYQGAIADFTKSLQLSENAMTYMKRGYTYMLMGQFALAIEDENKALGLHDPIAKAYYVRGACKFNLNDMDGAEKDLANALDLDRTNASAFNYMAAVKIQKQDFKEALDNYNLVVKLDSSFPDIWTNRGMVRHYLKDFSGAISDYNVALRRDPKNSSAYNNRGAAKMMLKDYKGALPDFDKAIVLNPRYSEAYNNRGRVKHFLGDDPGACKDWNMAFDLGLADSKDMIIKYCK